MNYYEKSREIFKNKIQENKEITKKEWDKYAYDNCLFSSNVLEFHSNVDTFEKLKRELS